MMISFMILGNELTIKDRISKLIERKLTEEMDIDCKILTSNRFDEALEKANIINIDVHVVHCPSDEENNVIDYLSEISKKYPDSPVIPVIVVSSSGIELSYQVKLFNDFRIIGFRDEPDNAEGILTDLKKAVTFVQMLDDRKITFKRPSYSQVYNERDIYCVMRMPYGQKRIVVTASENGEITQEEFTIKSNLAEVRLMFADKNMLVRCHQSWLVNPKMIMKVDGINDMLILSNGFQIPFGRTYLKNLSHIFY